MIWFGVLAAVLGALGGNVAAVAVPAANLGLWWNSMAGGMAALVLLLLPEGALPWPSGQRLIDLPAMAGAGFLAVLVIGGLVALAYRD